MSKPIPGSDGLITKSVMKLIQQLDEEQRTVLLGENPDAVPDVAAFEKLIEPDLAPDKVISTEAFLELCYKSQMSFREGFLAYHERLQKRS